MRKTRFLVLVAAVLVTGCSAIIPAKNSDTASSSSSSSSVNTGTNTYCDPHNTFCFDYAANWTVSDSFNTQRGDGSIGLVAMDHPEVSTGDTEVWIEVYAYSQERLSSLSFLEDGQKCRPTQNGKSCLYCSVMPGGYVIAGERAETFAKKSSRTQCKDGRDCVDVCEDLQVRSAIVRLGDKILLIKTAGGEGLIEQYQRTIDTLVKYNDSTSKQSTYTLLPLPSETIQNYASNIVYRYSITAPADQDITINNQTFVIEGGRWQGPQLRIYDQPTFMNQLDTWTSTDNWTESQSVVLTGDLMIPAGQTRYLELSVGIGIPADLGFTVAVKHTNLPRVTLTDNPSSKKDSSWSQFGFSLTLENGWGEAKVPIKAVEDTIPYVSDIQLYAVHDAGCSIGYGKIDQEALVATYNNKMTTDTVTYGRTFFDRTTKDTLLGAHEYSLIATARRAQDSSFAFIYGAYVPDFPYNTHNGNGVYLSAGGNPIPSDCLGKFEHILRAGLYDAKDYQIISSTSNGQARIVVGSYNPNIGPDWSIARAAIVFDEDNGPSAVTKYLSSNLLDARYLVRGNTLYYIGTGKGIIMSLDLQTNQETIVVSEFNDQDKKILDYVVTDAGVYYLWGTCDELARCTSELKFRENNQSTSTTLKTGLVTNQFYAITNAGIYTRVPTSECFADCDHIHYYDFATGSYTLAKARDEDTPAVITQNRIKYTPAVLIKAGNVVHTAVENDGRGFGISNIRLIGAHE